MTLWSITHGRACLTCFASPCWPLTQAGWQVKAKHGPEITEAALLDMTYADACVKEALRIR